LAVYRRCSHLGCDRRHQLGVDGKAEDTVIDLAA
jgi:hypothetical protein